MQIRKQIKFSHFQKTLAITLTAVVLNSCGNAWMSSQKRKNSPSALMLSGQWAYDKGDFENAVNFFQQVVDSDTANANARIRLAYAINAHSGLNPLDLIAKLANLNKAPAASATPKAALEDANLFFQEPDIFLDDPKPASGASSVTAFAEVIGLSKVEKDALYLKKLKTIDQLRAASPRYALLHRSWKAICQLIPKSALDSVVGKDKILQKNLEIENCKGGLPATSKERTSALFAAAIGSMAQAAGLYQIALDYDGDGQIDLVTQAQSITTDLTALNAKAKELGSKGTQTIDDITALGETMSQLNTKMAELTSLSATLKGELINLTLAHFGFVALLTAGMGMPESMTKSITGTLSKFNEAKDKLNGFLSAGSPAAGGAGGTDKGTQSQQIAQNAAKASEAVDTLILKQTASINANTDLTPEQKTEKLAVLEKNKQQSCSNFENLKVAYNLPANTAPPTQCTATALYLNDVVTADQFN